VAGGPAIAGFWGGLFFDGITGVSRGCATGVFLGLASAGITATSSSSMVSFNTLCASAITLTSSTSGSDAPFAVLFI
jgi:hypothetical protein